MVHEEALGAAATLGAGKADNAWGFKQALRDRNVVPHMALRSDAGWGGAKIILQSGYEASRRHRKRIEEIFGWVKTAAGQAKTRFRGLGRVAPTASISRSPLLTKLISLAKAPQCRRLAMTAPTDECALIGRWRITQADLWDQNYLDFCGPATLLIAADGHGEIGFGALQAGLNLEFAQTSVFFEWKGFDEMDELPGSVSATTQDDQSLETHFNFHNGDQATLKAVKI